jgi:hypothetical protein
VHLKTLPFCDQSIEALPLRPEFPRVDNLIMSHAEILRIGLQHECPSLYVGDSNLDAFEFFENLDRHGVKNGLGHAVAPSAVSVPVEPTGTGAEAPIIKSAAFSALPAAYITRSASALIAVAQF